MDKIKSFNEAKMSENNGGYQDTFQQSICESL
jgi:hypothetical protein